MNVIEESILLLCCRLGDSGVKPMTMAQFRDFGLRVAGSLIGGNHLTQLTTDELRAFGYCDTDANRIIDLLDRRQSLQNYLSRGAEFGIYPITRASDAYPRRIAAAQGFIHPPVLFAMGDASLLQKPCIAVVGSRGLKAENETFARDLGRKIAEEGFVLVSGGADGADTAAQLGCLEAGGSCVIYTPHSLCKYRPHENILYLSVDGYDLHFSAARALYRNKLIHAQAEKAFAAQSSYQRGGTWQGCTENLKHGWSDLFIYDDGSVAVSALEDLGATKLRCVPSIRSLQRRQQSLFD